MKIQLEEEEEKKIKWGRREREGGKGIKNKREKKKGTIRGGKGSKGRDSTEEIAK